MSIKKFEGKLSVLDNSDDSIASSGGLSIAKNVSTQMQLRMYSSNSNYISLHADLPVSNIDLTLPNTLPASSGSFLICDTSGNLTFSEATSGGAGTFTTITVSDQITSTLANGTAPLVISSSTVVNNLNANLLNGFTFSDPGVIGGITPDSATFTSISITDSVNSTVVSNGSIHTPGGIGVAKAVTIGSTFSEATSSSKGNYLTVFPGTFTDTSTPAAGTLSNWSSIYISQATVAGSNTSITTTNANTFYIHGPPIQGANETFGNSYSLNINSGGSKFGGQIISTVTTGTAPLVISSSTNVPNLNASTLSGATFASPGAIGSTVAGSGAFTTISASSQITSTVSTGTAPFIISSTTNVPNLNANYLNGSTFASPGAIGTSVPGSGTFTGLTSNSVTLNGTVSGAITLIPNDTTSTYNFNLPTNPGTSGQVLVSDGPAGSMYWATVLTATAVTNTFSGANNISSPTGISGLFYSSGYFEIDLSVDIIATENLTQLFKLEGVLSGGVSLWNISVLGSTGDDTGILFYINSSGQVQYTSNNYPGFVSLTFSWTSYIAGSSGSNVTAGVNTMGAPDLGNFFTVAGSTFTDNVTANSGTLTDFNSAYIAQATISSVSTSVTTTNANSLYIAGPPIAGTNETIGNRYSLNIASGGSKFGGQIISTVSTGTAPLVIASTTNVPNLNASSLNGATFASPGAIGGTSAGASHFTTVSASSQITSTVSTGTAPLVIASTTNVPNLNASSLSGATFASPGAIGSSTPSTSQFTDTTISGITTIGPTANSSSSALFISGSVIAAPSGSGIHIGIDPSSYASIQMNAIGAAGSYIDFSSSGTDSFGRIIYDNTLNRMTFSTSTTARCYIDVNGLNVTGRISSGVSTGTAPFVVSSTTNVANLNASSINGATFASPGTIGGITAGSGSFTTISASSQITSTVNTGTAPLVIASTTNVPNLNASSLSGATFASPGSIGSTSAGSGAFTSLSSTGVTSFTESSTGTTVSKFNASTATSSTTVLGVIKLKAPTITILSSGSGTYTTPSSVIYFKIVMVGGGGGGGGANTGGSAPTIGVSGAATIFGSSFLTCNGGNSTGAANGGSGGSSSIGSGAAGLSFTGSSGGGASYSTAFQQGGSGGSSPFGGAGQSVYSGSGTNAIGGTGSGGGGGGCTSNSNVILPGGGGAGGYISCLVSTILSSYSYSIGTGGSGGVGNISTGGNGGSGIISIEEYYQ